ncbi:FtsX-like permease family protein [Kribbella qitaiheensis]|uniref:FtsX-like permease family protein n=1 Tax=Kribbella qitaiheensis TaxID=1544730 RepID=A0A7G6WZR4_9ACTN|nr:FtsX-like permease family protein [Kribbella qitaiheensis]QNE19479.1 FtsX-like permease family protein [Kribbella qitaiheensis]
MNLATLFELARPRSATDRSRFRLLVATIAIAGAFLLAAWRIKRLGFRGYYYSDQYSDYIQEDGIRTGVAFAAVLLAVASCLLAFQALKLGTAARDRRLGAFRLAGATPNQVRALGAVDAGIAGLIGGLLTGPLYLLLALAIQTLPRTARMLPPANSVDLATWPIVAVVLAVAAAIVGALLGRGVVAEPRERPAKTANVTRAAVACAVGIGLVLLSGLVYRASSSFLVLIGLGLVVVCLALPTVLVAWQGNRLERSGNPLKVLAGGRLLRTVRPHARTLALLVLCGTALGFVGAMGFESLRPKSYSYDTAFYVPGLVFAAGAAVFIALIAGISLLAGTADDLLDQRRQLAALNVLGVGEAQLRASVRYQLTAGITWAVACGLLIGGVLYAHLSSIGSYSPDQSLGLLVTAGVAVVGAGLAWLVGAAAAFLLRGHVHEAAAPENLRST